MKKSIKRYKSTLEIRAEIHRLKKQAVTKLQDAELICDEVKASRKSGVEAPRWLVDSNNMNMKKADKLRRTAQLIEEKRIPRLIRTLQKLNTQPFDFIKDDTSVQLSE